MTWVRVLIWPLEMLCSNSGTVLKVYSYRPSQSFCMLWAPFLLAVLQEPYTSLQGWHHRRKPWAPAWTSFFFLAEQHVTLKQVHCLYDSCGTVSWEAGHMEKKKCVCCCFPNWTDQRCLSQKLQRKTTICGNGNTTVVACYVAGGHAAAQEACWHHPAEAGVS